MDKRTLVFVLSLTLTLYFVNIYFQNQKQAELHEWSLKQKLTKEKELQELKTDISQDTVKARDLPLVSVYEDGMGTHLLTLGVQAGENILTLSGTFPLPKTVFVKTSTHNEQLVEMTLTLAQEAANSIVLFQSAHATKIPIAEIPEFGQHDVQLISFHPTKVTLGKIVEGDFFIPQQKIEQIESEIAETDGAAKKVEKPQIPNSIALIKTAQGFLPVGYYSEEEQKLFGLNEIPELTDFLAKPDTSQDEVTNQKAEEKFYVLENDYQQLVFSNVGGALVEINLPFQTTQDQESVVKPIEFDREMVEKFPWNARFPAHTYFKPEMIEVKQGKLGGFYPLLRRDLIDNKNKKTVRIPPRYYAFNIVSEYPEMAELIYEVKEFTNNSITFDTIQSRRRITKKFSIESESKGAPYCVDVSINIEGDSRGLWVTSGVPEVEMISGSPAPALKYRITRNQKSDVENIDLSRDYNDIYPDWLCNSNGFFGIIMDPLTEAGPGFRAQKVSGVVVPTKLLELNNEYQRFNAQDLPGHQLMIPLKGKGGTTKFRSFCGPLSSIVLNEVDKTYTDAQTGYNPDYIASQTFHGWFSFISEPFAKILFFLMNYFHQVTNSWTLSIVLLTVALRVILYPLNAWSTRSMLRMQQIAPEVNAIQEKHKKDPKKAQLEIMNLYRERGANPVSGCFPLLIQMPFLVGMFDLLKSTFELRGASFIPGWIDNLTAPDVLFSWNTPIMLIGTQFHLLPILLGVVMFAQQRLMSPLPKDPKQLTEQQKQQKSMGTIMTLVFSVMFYNLPSGLNIYWLASMLLGMLQQWWMQRQMVAKPSKPTTVATKR